MARVVEASARTTAMEAFMSSEDMDGDRNRDEVVVVMVREVFSVGSLKHGSDDRRPSFRPSPRRR